MLVRLIISRIKQDLNKLNLDQNFSNRYIYSKLITAASVLIKRETDNRKIFRQTHLFKQINVELTRNSGSTGLVKSVNKVPKFFTSNSGNLLMVNSVDFSNSIRQIAPENYNIIKQREFQDPNNNYYWIIDDYLYITNNFLRSVPVRGLFYDHVDGECQKILDTEFPCPDYLLEDTVNLTLNSLYNREKVAPDENPDQNTLSK